MCIIIDANASQFFKKPQSADFRPIWDWLNNKGGKLVYGGKLAEELRKITDSIRLLKQLSNRGVAIREDDNKISKEEAKVRAIGCKSNDSHVIALARVSYARVLCSDDEKLHEDFKNLKVVSSPKGKIYQKASHKNLLSHNNKCYGKKIFSRNQEKV